MFIPDERYGKPNFGNNVQIVGQANFGSEPYLITVGDNTTISFDCAFVTHDAATRVIRNLEGYNKETVIYGPITIGKNCFIGCPSNVVAAGTPCKVICTLDEYIKKHKKDFLYMVSLPIDKKREFLLKHFNIQEKTSVEQNY